MRVQREEQGVARVWFWSVEVAKALPKFALGALAVAAVCYFVFLLRDAFTRHALEIAPIAVTKDLDERGYTPSVVADRLRDAVNTLIVRSQTDDKIEAIGLKGEEPDVTVPEIGVSIDTVVASISSHFHRARVQHVWGEIVRRDARLWLTLRLDQAGVIATSDADEQHPDALFEPAARAILARTQPEVLGLVLFDEGKHDQAIAQFRKAVLLEPNSAHVHNGFGYVLAESGQQAASIQEFLKAISLDPHYALPRRSLGTMYEKQGKLDDALAQYRAAVAIDPQHASAYAGMADILDTEGKHDEALADARKAIELDPDSAADHVQLGNLLSDDKQPGAALAEFRKAIALDRTDKYARLGAGDALLDEGKFVEAIGQFRAAVALDPRWAHAHERLGLAYADAGDDDASMRALREAIRLDPHDAVPHHILAELFRDEGKLAAAAAEDRTAKALSARH